MQHNLRWHRKQLASRRSSAAAAASYRVVACRHPLPTHLVTGHQKSANAAAAITAAAASAALSPPELGCNGRRLGVRQLQHQLVRVIVADRLLVDVSFGHLVGKAILRCQLIHDACGAREQGGRQRQGQGAGCGRQRQVAGVSGGGNSGRAVHAATAALLRGLYRTSAGAGGRAEDDAGVTLQRGGHLMRVDRRRRCRRRAVGPTRRPCCCCYCCCHCGFAVCQQRCLCWLKCGARTGGGCRRQQQIAWGQGGGQAAG